MNSGSTLWQIVFLSFALVLILFEVVRGWRLGVVRQIVRLIAIVAAYLTAIFGGKLLLPMIRPFVKVPDIVIAVLAGAVLALTVYFVLVTVGAILFKRTAQQKSGLVRLLYGLCGAVTGIFFGLFAVWLVIIAIRSLGALADAQLKTQAALRTAPPSPLQRPLPSVQSTPATEPALVNSLAKLKNSLELGPVGNVVKGADVVPTSTYETLGKVGQLASNPESAERFLSYPGARELTRNPRIVALRDDPEIIRIIEEGRFFDLLNHPRVIEAINDPALAAQVKSFEFQKALNHAVGR